MSNNINNRNTMFLLDITHTFVVCIQLLVLLMVREHSLPDLYDLFSDINVLFVNLLFVNVMFWSADCE